MLARMLPLTGMLACHGDSDAVGMLVELSAASPVRAATTRLHVNMRRLEPDAAEELSRDLPNTWPARLHLRPREDAATRRFALTVEAFDAADASLALAQLQSDFLPGELRYVKLELETCDNCGGERAACPTIAREAETLGTSLASAPLLKVNCGTATAGDDCPSERDRACSGHASLGRLICSGGIWRELPSCEAEQRCDTSLDATRGSCRPLASPCEGSQPGAFACEGDVRVRCGVDLVSHERQDCPPNAHCDITGERTDACVCDAGYERNASDECVRTPSCPQGACSPGGHCLATADDYTCTCDAGFVNKDSRTCVPDLCQQPNVCAAAYPCSLLTPATDYTCSGQFADWAMPDNAPGANVAPSYDVSSASVVLDNVTQLMWERVVPDTFEGCTGANATPGDTCTWQQAIAYCENLELAGFDDWRLPSRIELESTLNPYPSSFSFALDTNVFQGRLKNSRRAFMWTRSPVAASSDSAWAVYFYEGTAFQSMRSVEYSARCVRTLALPPGQGTAGRYLVHADTGIVADVRTGLSWQRASEAPRTWSSAGSYCSGLTLDGSGWRLPTYKELLTLVNPEAAQPAIDTTAFPGTAGEAFWSSSERTSSSSPSPTVFAWAVSFADGTASNVSAYRTLPSRSDTSSTARVRCVR